MCAHLNLGIPKAQQLFVYNQRIAPIRPAVYFPISAIIDGRGVEVSFTETAAKTSLVPILEKKHFYKYSFGQGYQKIMHRNMIS